MTAEPLPPYEEVTDQPSVTALLSLIHDLGKASPEFQAAVARLFEDARLPNPGRRLQVVGKARKVSVSMPEDLTTAVQQRVGRGHFSQYVTDAVVRQLELDLLGELADLLQTEHGTVPEEALAEARRAWPDAR